MGPKDLPPEILSLIISLLVERANSPSEWRDNLQHICNARLVCRLWNTLATTYVFENLVLAYTTDEYKAWGDMIDSGVVKQAARRVYIRTAPDDDHEGGIWNAYTKKGHDGLIKSITRISELEHIKELYLRFSKHCNGVEVRYRLREEVVEDIAIRHYILENVFRAIQSPARNNFATSDIRTLTIENLQNTPLPDFTSSELFRAVTKNINFLHLMVADEYNEARPDWDAYRLERRVFEPLTTLNLGNFVIGHHEQFDWVLNQSSLTSLRLDRCSIVSYLATFRENIHSWQVRTHDWHEYPTGSFGLDASDAIYGFSGTWETIFNSICRSLPRLSDFRFRYGHDPVFPVRPDKLSVGLTKKRYTAFEDNSWNDVDESGFLTFGDSLRGRPDKRYLNRSEETEVGDYQALDALIQEVRKRQQQLTLRSD
ncbi:hypothetical protein PHISCL_05356 [Aspergillus sclerotialis]|uniref:F-box domain-containing protein n=1 Tax=Aspergillus sclerotialis TaxID=2070753 RepID=A0A3A2ZGT8_9EURO|nr:hypothetical protein PHISCL_05356 [Aspergillus sclerotialis]